MKIVAYSGDVGGEIALRDIVAAANAMGHEATLILSSEKGKPFATFGKMRHGLEAAETVLLTPSAFVPDGTGLREEETLAHVLSGGGTPVWWIEDMPVARFRVTSFSVRTCTKIVRCTPSVKGTEGYGKSVYVGYPATWRKTYETLTGVSREEIRAKFLKYVTGVGGVSLSPNDVLINIVGVKSPELVLRVVGAVEAYAATERDGKIVIGVRAHPREDDQKDGDVRAITGRLATLTHNRNGFFYIKDPMREGIPAFSATGQVLTNAELMRAADLTIFPGGMSTDILPAVMAGITVGYYTDRENEERNAAQGDCTWPALLEGSAHIINGVDDVSRALNYLLSAEGRAEILAAQQTVLPSPGPDGWMGPEGVVKVITGASRP